jgi:hypothetical protein
MKVYTNNEILKQNVEKSIGGSKSVDKTKVGFLL